MRYSFTWLQWERGHRGLNLSISACGFDHFSAITSTETCDTNDLVFRMFYNESFLTQLLMLHVSFCHVWPFSDECVIKFHILLLTLSLFRRLSLILLKCQLCLRRKTLLRSILKSLRRHVRSFLSGEKSENSSRFREPGLDFSCLRMCDIFVYVYLLSCSWHSPQWHVSNAHVIRQWLYF